MTGLPFAPETWVYGRTELSWELLQEWAARLPILEAAAHVFTTQGVYETTVQAILDRAGVSRGTFYKYFRNKEEVVAELYALAAQMLLATIREAADRATTPQDKLRAGVDVFLEIHVQWGALIRVLQPEAARPDSPLYPRRQQLLDGLAQLLDEGVRQFQGRQLDPLVFQSLALAMESLAIYVLPQVGVHTSAFQRARQVMLSLLEHVLAPPGSQPTPLPTRPVSVEQPAETGVEHEQ